MFKYLSSSLLALVLGGLLVVLYSSKKAMIVDSSNLTSIEINIYQQGNKRSLRDTSPNSGDVQSKAEALLGNAKSTYRMVVTDQFLADLKKGTVLEIGYPDVQNNIIPFNKQRLYFTRILIPLSGKFANGTVFFKGIYAFALGGKEPDYRTVSNSNGAVINDQGIEDLKKSLQQAGITID